jgi:hypothetical protein
MTIKPLAQALERAGIAYAIGGSVASSVRGDVRATNDVDIVAQIGVAQVDALVAALGPEWYADAEQMRASIRSARSFNVTYIPLAQKVVIFQATRDFHRAQLDRATEVEVPLFDDKRAYPVTSAEDILLAKLEWYAAGGQVSEMQWRDITSVLAIARGLDHAYLEEWAGRLGVAPLLARAIEESRD